MSVHSSNRHVMKKTIYLFIIVTALVSCCDNVYTNGDLDGMWQLQTVEDMDKKSVQYPKDIYYSFQRNLTFISRMNETDIPLRYLGNMYYNNDKSTVNINGLRNFPNETLIATKEILEQFMIFDTDVTFTIKTLDNKQLIMDYNRYRYTLKRW